MNIEIFKNVVHSKASYLVFDEVYSQAFLINPCGYFKYYFDKIKKLKLDLRFLIFTDWYETNLTWIQEFLNNSQLKVLLPSSAGLDIDRFLAIKNLDILDFNTFYFEVIEDDNKVFITLFSEEQDGNTTSHLFLNNSFTCSSNETSVNPIERKLCDLGRDIPSCLRKLSPETLVYYSQLS